MSKFYDHVEALKGVEGDYPGDMLDTLGAAYDSDIAEQVSAAEIAQAAVAERDVQIAGLIAENNALKAAKFDELMNTPVDDGDSSDDPEDGSEDEPVNTSDPDSDPINDLFK